MAITKTEQTWTIDTANSPWVYSDGQKTTILGTSQDFKITLVDDDGTATATFEGSGMQGSQGVALADGGKLQFSSDTRMVKIGQALANATAKLSAGSFWVSANNGPEEEVKITSLTIADVDSTGANNITTMTMEYPGKPYKWTWATIQNA
jgi:hypothetical protein